MKESQSILQILKEELEKINTKNGIELKRLHQVTTSLSNLTAKFDDLWIGSWGQGNYNHYRNPKKPAQGREIDVKYIYKLISTQENINLETLESEILINIKPFKNFKKKLITEMTFIRNNENLINENEILKKIEDFKWEIDADEYVQFSRPNHIIVHRIQNMINGILTPPHILAKAYIINLSTKAYSYNPFNDLANRLIRQIEIKTNQSIDGVLTNENLNVLNNIFNNFHSFCNQLKDRYDKRNTIFVNDEYDVQDLLHCILKLHYVDVRKEEYTPSYGGSSTRMDFLLKNENTVIEVKKTREKLTDKEVGEQLIIDVAHYRNHPNCNILKCFVYDPENRIRNPRGLENDINKLSDKNMLVELYIRP